MPLRKLTREGVVLVPSSLLRTWSTRKLSGRHCQRLHRYAVNSEATSRGNGEGQGNGGACRDGYPFVALVALDGTPWSEASLKTAALTLQYCSRHGDPHANWEGAGGSTADKRYGCKEHIEMFLEGVKGHACL